MSFEKRRSLYSGSGNGGDRDDALVGTVKLIDKAPDITENKVKVRFEGARKEDAIYVPKKYAKNMKPEHKYEFEIKEDAFRGGGQRRFSGSEMIQRVKTEPREIKSNGFGKGSTNAGEDRF